MSPLIFSQGVLNILLLLIVVRISFSLLLQEYDDRVIAIKMIMLKYFILIIKC